MVELSGLVDPGGARLEVSRDAIVQVTQDLRRLRLGDRWPKSFQVSALAYCKLAGYRVLLADEQGLGKTAIALCSILLNGMSPAVVVAPATVLLNWKAEAGYWLPGVPVHRLDRVHRSVPPPGWRGIVVTTWDLLRYHSEALVRLKPKVVIADEAHYVIHPGTERADHFERLVESVPHLMLLTGTPIVNKATELWRLLRLVQPRAWPEATRDAFKELDKEAFDKGLQSRLTRRIRCSLIRRLKTDALEDLEAKLVRPVRINLPADAMRQYKQLEREFDEKVEEGIRDALNSEGWAPPLDCSDPETAFEVEVGKRRARSLSARALVLQTHLRKLVGVLKVPAATRWIVEVIRSGEPVVVFAYHQEVISALADALARRGAAYGVIDGKTPKTRRHSLVGEFQGGKIDALVCSTAAREGITLTRAKHVLRAERWWTSASEDQGADRLHRIGQKRQVEVWELVAAGTIDERMDATVQRKRRITVRTVDHKEAASAPFSDPASKDA